VLLFLLFVIFVSQSWQIVKTLFKRVKHYTNKKARMTTTIFTEFQRKVGTSIGVQGRNILLFWINGPLIHKIHHCVLCNNLHKHALHLDWTGLDAEKDVNTSSYAAVDNELATHAVSCMDKLCDDHGGGSSSGNEEREM
jgi:hypothetical protein